MPAARGLPENLHIVTGRFAIWMPLQFASIALLIHGRSTWDSPVFTPSVYFWDSRYQIREPVFVRSFEDLEAFECETAGYVSIVV